MFNKMFNLTGQFRNVLICTSRLIFYDKLSCHAVTSEQTWQFKHTILSFSLNIVLVFTHDLLCLLQICFLVIAWMNDKTDRRNFNVLIIYETKRYTKKKRIKFPEILDQFYKWHSVKKKSVSHFSKYLSFILFIFLLSLLESSSCFTV